MSDKQEALELAKIVMGQEDKSRVRVLVERMAWLILSEWGVGTNDGIIRWLEDDSHHSWENLR